MQVPDYLALLFRWLHILAGILWIGLLYFFNFVNGPFAATLDGDTKKKVVPELMPRALYWFRWGSAYTLFTGLLLLGLVFEMSTAALKPGTEWTVGGHLFFWSFLILPMVYDMLSKSPLGKDNRIFAAICFVLVCVLLYFAGCVGLGYRGYMIYTGALFGTTMAMNVWMRIWPNQKRIINGIKNGPPADPSVAALAGLRSKHNTYMSVPLVWMMINAHSTALDSEMGWCWLAAAILVGWGAVWMVYKKAATIKGF